MPKTKSSKSRAMAVGTSKEKQSQGSERRIKKATLSSAKAAPKVSSFRRLNLKSRIIVVGDIVSPTT